MSVYRPPLGRGRGRARQRDTYSPGAEPSRLNKDGPNVSDRWGHDLYDERNNDRWDHDDNHDKINTDRSFRGGTNKELSTNRDKRQENRSCSTPTSRIVESEAPKSQPRSERTRGRGKRPDMQVYVPRGRRSQDAVKTSTDKTSSRSPATQLNSSSKSPGSQTPHSASDPALQQDHKESPSLTSSYINNDSHTPVRANKKRKVLDRRKEKMEDNDGMAVISHQDNQSNIKESFLDSGAAAKCSGLENDTHLEDSSFQDNRRHVNPRTTSRRINKDLGLPVETTSRKDNSSDDSSDCFIANINSLNVTSLETNSINNTIKTANNLQTICKDTAESDDVEDELWMVCDNDTIGVPKDISAIIDTCDKDNSECVNRTAVMDIPSTSDLILTDSSGILVATHSIHERPVSICEKAKEQSDLNSMDISSYREVKPETLNLSNLVPSSDKMNQPFSIRNCMNDTEDIAGLHLDRHHDIADKPCHLLTDVNTVPDGHERMENNSTHLDVISTVLEINDESHNFPVTGGCDPSINHTDEIMPIDNQIKSLDNDSSCQNVGLSEQTTNLIGDPTEARMETESGVIDMEKSEVTESITASDDTCVNPQEHQTVSIAETVQVDDAKTMIDTVRDKTNTDSTVQVEKDEALKQENKKVQSENDETGQGENAETLHGEKNEIGQGENGEEGHFEIFKTGEVDYNEASQCVKDETVQGGNDGIDQSENNETVQRDVDETVQRDFDETVQGEDNETCHGDNDDEEDDDTWDSMFNEDGDCLDPSVMEELTQKVGKVKIQKSKKINYLDYKPKDKGEVEYTEYGHIIEIFDFPAEFVTRDLISAFQSFLSRGFDLKWVDDTHALGIFSSSIAAQDAAGLIHPLIKVRPLSQASQQSRIKARRCSEFLKPYKPRPETSASAARRLVAGALGLATNVSKEKRERERQQLKEAKEKRKKDRKNREDIWEYGKCAMDEET